MNIAIVQDKLIYGGRLDLLVHLIFYLNKKDFVPTIFSYNLHDVTEDGIYDRYGVHILYNFHKVSQRINLSQDLSIIKFNLSVGRYISKFDLIINSSNSSFGIRTRVPMIDYIHFPREARAYDRRKSIHDWNNTRRKVLNRGFWINLLVRVIYRSRRSIRNNIRFVGNSLFTIENIKNIFPVEEVALLYPPIEIQKLPESLGDEKKVVTLGRFSPAKNQIEQIRLAKRVPGVRFYIIGFGTEDNLYLQKCKKIVKSENIGNVELCVNLSNEERNRIMSDCGILLHTTRNEPFGLSVAQALSYGCVPLIPAEGGAREIVNEEELQYSELGKLVTILKSLSNDRRRLSDLHGSLYRNLKQFNIDSFETGIERIIYESLQQT